MDLVFLASVQLSILISQPRFYVFKQIQFLDTTRHHRPEFSVRSSFRTLRDTDELKLRIVMSQPRSYVFKQIQFLDTSMRRS